MEGPITVLATEQITSGSTTEEQTLLLQPDGGWSASCTCGKYETEKKCGHRTAAIQKWGREGKIPGVKPATAQPDLPTNGEGKPTVVQAEVMRPEPTRQSTKPDNTPRPVAFDKPEPRPERDETESPRALAHRPVIPGLPSLDEFQRAEKLAEAFLESGFAPTALAGVTKEGEAPKPVKLGAIIAAIQWGAELGLAPMESMRSIYVAHGRVGIAAAAALALCIRKVPGFRFKIVRRDESAAEITVVRAGQEPAAFRFSWEDAVRAGLTTGRNAHSYQKWPRNMLWARCVAEMVRTYCADALGSAYVQEELDDLETTVTVTTPAPPEAPKQGEDVAGAFPSAQPKAA
jgi:hypothetical protein